ncbi:S8 family peptidase [Streptomyces sp. NPDC019224]|uniref:S8 family peptidase n=1 Tax=Streptomyces sp. NPDC019224 TaxID=3154484 RepID=UPI0033EF3D4A
MRRRKARRPGRRLGALTAGVVILGMAVPAFPAQAAQPVQQVPASGTAGTTDRTTTPGSPLDNAELADVVASSGGAVDVTLVTGDTVSLGLNDDGKPVVRDTEAAHRTGGPATVFHTITRRGQVHVVPNDAMHLLSDGVLDWSLFDLTALSQAVAASGGAEARAEVPVIVTYKDEHDVAKAPKVAGARTGRALRSVGGRSLGIAGNGTWWRGVRGKTGPASAARSAGSLAGVEKVWLNGVSRVSLDVSVPQIGTGVARSRGLDGKGVRVAVLDSGIDATHPDLAGRIEEKTDFTGKAPDAKDGQGHGTHVASTILGDGAASGGKYTGVAPGARLLVGKVCDDNGVCEEADMIAGMEWAAHSGAKVVNMSIGGEPTDGTDPLSMALNRLSQETGTLFVVAAGNAGPGTSSVGTPGVADEALTVAAVDKSDKMAPFSSRGPRPGDYAAKPDIAAPGVAIVAARAAGTSLGTPVDDNYTSASGTSMATPHVAGAAALVAQQHPELRGDQIKALLMSTAKDLGYDEKAQGAGRVDLAEATDPRIIAAGNLSFGRRPHDSAPVTRTVTYSNLTGAAATLDLTASATSGGASAPAGLLTLDRHKLTLPAGGSADVEVTLDSAALGAQGSYGRWDGRLTARDTSGTVRTATRVQAVLEAERAPLTLNVIPPEGATSVTYGDAVFLPVDDRDPLYDGLVAETGGESTTAQLYKAGTYAATIPVTWKDGSGEEQRAVPLAPEVKLTGATTVTLDLRKLVPVSVRTSAATETYSAVSSTARISATGAWAMATALRSDYQARETSHWWALPTGKVRTGTLTQNTYSVRTTPVVTMKAVGGGPALDLAARYQTPDTALVTVEGRQLPSGLLARQEAVAAIPRLATEGRVPVVDAGSGTPAELAAAGVDGKLVLMRPTDLCGTTCDFAELRDTRVKAAAAEGAKGVLVAAPGLTSLGGTYSQLLCPGGPETCPALEPYAALPVVSVDEGQAARLVERLKAHPGTVRIELGGSAEPKVYAASFVAEGAVPSGLQYRLDTARMRPVVQYFHADRPGTVHQLSWLRLSGSTPLLPTLDLPLVPTRSTLTVYLQPQDDAVDRFTAGWGDNTEHSTLTGARSETQEVVLTRQKEVHWNEGPSVPGAARQVRTASGYTVASGPCSACRQGDTFYPTFYVTSSGGGRQAMVGVLNNQSLTENTFGTSACGPTLPELRPTEDALCDFSLKDKSGHEIERRTQELYATDTGEIG